MSQKIRYFTKLLMYPWWIQLLNHAIDTTGKPDCCAYCSLLITCWVFQHSTLQLCIVVSFLNGWTLISVFSWFQNWIEDMWDCMYIAWKTYIYMFLCMYSSNTKFFESCCFLCNSTIYVFCMLPMAWILFALLQRLFV